MLRQAAAAPSPPTFCDEGVAATNHLSFTDTKLAEDRIENLLHVYDTNYFADRSQRLIKINGNVFPRHSASEGRLRAIA
jgi:hypothetical protein